jgi:hypothetical protein
MSFKIEKSLRLDTFQADCPIILGNGEAFHFRPPRFLCYPTVNQDGRILMAMGGLNYGPEWVEHTEVALEDEDNDKLTFDKICWFADRMLIRNYKEEVRKYYNILLPLHAREPETTRKFYQIWDMVRGFDPKGLTSDGSRPA